MTKDEVIQEVGKPILRPIGLMQGLFLLAILVSPFIWLWHSSEMAWKTALTGIIGMLITKFIYSVAKKVIELAAEYEIKKHKPKSSFQERLETLQQERLEKIQKK